VMYAWSIPGIPQTPAESPLALPVKVFYKHRTKSSNQLIKILCLGIKPRYESRAFT
jgi:hypothetical protein